MEAWRTRSLAGLRSPYLVVDADDDKVRREGRVRSTAVLWVVGMSEEGFREHVGVWLGASESRESWGQVFRELTGRGLEGVAYVVGDEHVGLLEAVKRYFPAAEHQRCRVHYLRNALAYAGSEALGQELRTALEDVWAAPVRAEAEARWLVCSTASRRDSPPWLKRAADGAALRANGPRAGGAAPAQCLSRQPGRETTPKSALDPARAGLNRVALLSEPIAQHAGEVEVEEEEGSPPEQPHDNGEDLQIEHEPIRTAPPSGACEGHPGPVERRSAASPHNDQRYRTSLTAGPALPTAPKSPWWPRPSVSEGRYLVDVATAAGAWIAAPVQQTASHQHRRRPCNSSRGLVVG